MDRWHRGLRFLPEERAWLDYFFVTPDLAPMIVDAFILPDVKGSDHCPVGLTLNLSATPRTPQALAQAE